MVSCKWIRVATEAGSRKESWYVLIGNEDMAVVLEVVVAA